MQREGLCCGRSRELPQEYQQVAGERVGTGIWVGVLGATPRPQLTDSPFPQKEVSRSSAVNDRSRVGGGQQG